LLQYHYAVVISKFFKKHKLQLVEQFTFKDDGTVVCINCKNQFTEFKDPRFSYHLSAQTPYALMAINFLKIQMNRQLKN